MTQEAFPEFNVQTETRYGPMLYNKNDIYIGRSFELYGEFSHGEAHCFDAVVKPGMTVIEVGANIGAHTVFLARKVGPRGQVHAFEPQLVVFQTLCANLALNQLTNVVTYYAAAGSAAGNLLVPVLEPKVSNNFGGLGLGGFDTGMEVPVIPIDSLKLGSCHFLKADVEGMEESVLRGAEDTIRRHRPILYIEDDRPEKSDSLVGYIASLGYRMFKHTPTLFNPENFKANPENVFPNIVSKNLLCVHQSIQTQIVGMPELTPGGLVI